MLPTVAARSSLDVDGAALTDLAAFPVVRPVAVRYGDLAGDGRVTAVALAHWIEDSRVRADRPRYRRLVADGGLPPVRTLLAAQLDAPDGGPPEELAPTAWEIQYVHEVAHPRAYDVLLATDAVPCGRHYRVGLFTGERCVGLADGVGPELPA